VISDYIRNAIGESQSFTDVGAAGLKNGNTPHAVHNIGASPLHPGGHVIKREMQGLYYREVKAQKRPGSSVEKIVESVFTSFNLQNKIHKNQVSGVRVQGQKNNGFRQQSSGFRGQGVGCRTKKKTSKPGFEIGFLAFVITPLLHNSINP
jgi:hypothetical protein